jgi:hypothetical protein
VESPLLETKLYVPKLRRGVVARPRLSEHLSRGAAESKLTLISAPAGFGKTTLVAEWLAATATKERSAAWLSLDQSDNDPASFWSYLIAALQTAAPAVGATALSLLQPPQAPIEAVLAEERANNLISSTSDRIGLTPERGGPVAKQLREADRASPLANAEGHVLKAHARRGGREPKREAAFESETGDRHIGRGDSNHGREVSDFAWRSGEEILDSSTRALGLEGRTRGFEVFEACAELGRHVANNTRGKEAGAWRKRAFWARKS